ncbi:acyl carrier protein [Nocardia sp. NPDC051321]|uniref:acyl carrier protein n=1 Tax=Nocardia sp. NPDC051321 TaxID=3364323 RepID=UPI00378A3A1A
METITIDEIAALIRHAIRGKQADKIIIEETTELRDLGLSSLQIAEVVFTLEERRGVELDPVLASDAKTIGDVIALGNAALAQRMAS